MTYDEHLASRVRKRLETRSGFHERRMFGGICFLLDGNMTAGVLGASLILRVGVEHQQEALTHPHVREFDFTGRPSKGMVYIDPPALATDRVLGSWLDRGLSFVATLPPKLRPSRPSDSRPRSTRRTKKPR